MTTPTDDSDLRGLLDDAVSDVRPRGGPEEIRERAVRPSAARWVPLTVGAAAATVLVIGGAAWLAQSQPDRPPTASPVEPRESAPAQPSAGAQPSRTATVPVYYAGDTAGGRRLFPEQRRVADATGTDLQVAVDEALNGQPLDPDYDPWPVSGVSATATAADGVITIDLSGLSGPAGDLDAADAKTDLQALVWTADAATKTTLPVQFLVDGKPSDTLLSTDVSAPVPPTSADSALAPVQVTSPAEGATVPTQFEVTGRASTFEANVVWELKQGDITVRHGFTTAQECCTPVAVLLHRHSATRQLHARRARHGRVRRRGCRHQPGHQGRHRPVARPPGVTCVSAPLRRNPGPLTTLRLCAPRGGARSIGSKSLAAFLGRNRVTRSHLRLASVVGAIVLSGVAMAPALAATNLSSAGANALTVSVAGNENGTGNVTATNDGSGEKKTGDTEPPISDSGAQDFLSTGVLAQEATARAANGTGTSAACAGLAGDGGSVVNLGGSECLKPTNQVNGSFGSFDPSALLPTALGPLPDDLKTPLAPFTTQLTAALAQARAATEAQLGDMGLVAGVKVIEGRCTASPGVAQGSAKIVDGKIVVQGGGQTITLLDLPVNPPPNTHLVTNLSKVLTTVISALRTNFNSSLDGAGAPLNAVLDPIQQQVVDTAVTQAETNLAPLQENVLDITLNKQTRPSAGAIRVNALDVQVVPAAQDQLGSSVASAQIGNVVCGPSGREVTAAPAAPAPKAPRLPTAVSAGYGDMPAEFATEDSSHTADFILAAFAVLVATGAGAVTFRRLRR